jgi:LCP family protein required for cell wall assembly
MPFHARRPRDPRRKRHRFLYWLVPLLLLAGIAAAPLLFAQHYLGKMNREIPKLQANPAIAAEEAIDPSGHEDVFAQADVVIAENTADAKAPYANSEVVNLLLAGVDHGEGNSESLAQQYYPRSDAMILLSANQATKTITMVSLSRATYAALPGYANGRLNLAHAFGGPLLMVQAVEENYHLKIDGFMTIDFAGFTRVIDLMGGVELNLSEQEYLALKDSCHLDGPGPNALSGSEALRYVRLRWIDSDRSRTQRQRNVLEALARKALGMQATQLRNSVDAMLPLVTTNLSSLELLCLARIAGYARREASIPKAPMGLTLMDGTEVIILDWKDVRRDVRELLYAGIPDL